MADDGGTFIDGTVVNKALVDAVFDQIDDQAHSTTNPAVKPKATTDEVVAARGSLGTLDARLDVSLNENGTLKTQAGLVSIGQFQGALGSRNIALNGDLEDWSAGGAAAPDSFTLAGVGAAIARTGVAMGDTFHFGTGSGFAAKVTRVGNNWTLTQDVIAAADFAKNVNIKGQKFSVGVKAKTAVVSYLRIVVDDGVSTTASSFHTGGDTEEHLSVTHTVSNTATKLSVYVEGVGSNGDGYVGGFVFVFADLAPTDWQPLSVPLDATSTRRGFVALGTQSIPGLKQFDDQPNSRVGTTVTSGYDIILSGRFWSDIGDVGNVDAGEDVLKTKIILGNWLDANGKMLRFTLWGTFAGNANNKTIKAHFGATSISLLSGGFNGGTWHAEVWLIRTAAATQILKGTIWLRVAAGTPDVYSPAQATPGETLSGDVTFKITGEATTTNDIVCNGIFGEVVG